MTDFAFSSHHEIYFSNRNAVPIGQLAETLLALENIVKTCPSVIGALTRAEIRGVEVYVEAIESGSILEKIIVKVLFKNEAEFDAFLDKIGEKVRKPGMPRNILIGAVIAAIVGYGAWLAAKVSNPGGQTTIANNNTTIINLGAGQVDLTPEAFRAIVETAVKDQKELAKNTVKLFGPARADNQARIVIDGNDHLTFSPDVIAATPTSVKIDKQESVEHLRDVDLEIRAMDLDSTTRGWAALIPNKIDRRVRLKLDPGVKPSEVADRFSVRADVSIYYKLDKSGRKMVPDYIQLHEVIK